MKVFQVNTEYMKGDSTEVISEVQYVTSEDDTIKSVTDYFTQHCIEYEKDLKGVTEVLVIVQNIKGTIQ